LRVACSANCGRLFEISSASASADLRSARALHAPPNTMNRKPDDHGEDVKPAQLEHVTGGNIGTSIGSLFGADGAKWGGVADSILGTITSALGNSNAGSGAA
jgi:hypothetical protein